MTSVLWNINLEDSIRRIFSTIPNNNIMNIIEIGCFEGFGTLKLEKLLGSHPDSKIICIDPLEDCYVKDKKEFIDIDPIFVGQYNKFITNINPIKDKIILKRGYSNDILPTLEYNLYDFAYVDGDHSAMQVYTDGKLLFPLMKKNGVILFDDYYWSHNNEITKNGIEKFIEEFNDKINVLFRGPVQCAVQIK